MNKTLVLASTSPRRLRMLREYGIKYKAIAPCSDEKKTEKKMKGSDPAVIAQVIAHEKALSVLPSVKDGIILGADTIVVLGKDILGKPRNIKDAARILGRLSGVALIDARSKKTLLTNEVSHVTFDRISRGKIREYIRNNHVMDKAGAYAIQDGADPFIKKISGSYNNVVGLPVEKVISILKKF